MNENNIRIKDVVESYDKLLISNKRKELGREIAEMTILIQKLLNYITAQCLHLMVLMIFPWNLL